MIAPKRWAYDKGAEICMRLAYARIFIPTPQMNIAERILNRKMARLWVWSFVKLAVDIQMAKEKQMAEEACKHDMAGGDSKFCPGCGAALESSDPQVNALIDRRVKSILSEYGIKAPTKKGEGAPKKEGESKSLKDKLGLK